MADENIDPESFQRNKDAGALNLGCWYFMPSFQVGCYSIGEFDGILDRKPSTKHRHFVMCNHGFQSKCVETAKEARILAYKSMYYCDECLLLAKKNLDSELKYVRIFRARIEEADRLRKEEKKPEWLKIQPSPPPPRPRPLQCPTCKRAVPYDWEVCEEDRGGCGTRRDGQQFRRGANTVGGEGDMSTDEEWRRRHGYYPGDDIE